MGRPASSLPSYRITFGISLRRYVRLKKGSSSESLGTNARVCCSGFSGRSSNDILCFTENSNSLCSLFSGSGWETDEDLLVVVYLLNNSIQSPIVVSPVLTGICSAFYRRWLHSFIATDYTLISPLATQLYRY